MEELRSTLADYGRAMDYGRLRRVLLTVVECVLVASLFSPRVSEADELHWAAVVLISDPPHAAVYSGGMYSIVSSAKRARSAMAAPYLSAVTAGERPRDGEPGRGLEPLTCALRMRCSTG